MKCVRKVPWLKPLRVQRSDNATAINAAEHVVARQGSRILEVKALILQIFFGRLAVWEPKFIFLTAIYASNRRSHALFQHPPLTKLLRVPTAQVFLERVAPRRKCASL